MESILGLELTQDKIKILEIQATKKGLEVAHLNKIDLPSQSTKEGIIIEPKLVAERIATFLRENNIPTKKVIALVNCVYTFTKMIRLPHNLSDDQIRLNLEAELNQYQAFMGKEAVVDFNKLEEISEEGIKKINVLFTATFKALSRSYLKTLELAGLDLLDIDVPILSLLRALDGGDLKPSTLDVTLLMLIGEKYLEICILKGSRPRFLHSVEIDILDFDKDRANFIDRLVSTIKLVVNFYQARFIQGEEITRIFVNPLDVKYSQIHTLLQEKLPNIPIQLSRPLSKIYIDKEKSIDLDELRFAFSTLLGATLRLQDKGQPQPFNLNLLLRERTQREYRSTQIYLLFMALTFMLSIMIISLGWVVLKVNILQGRISGLIFQFKQPTQEMIRAISIKEKRDILERQTAEATLIMSSLPPPFYFKDISKAIVLVPQNLWLTDISLENQNKNLVLNGESTTEKPIFDYISELSGSGYFASVELISSKGQAEGIEFTIQCTIK